MKQLQSKFFLRVNNGNSEENFLKIIFHRTKDYNNHSTVVGNQVLSVGNHSTVVSNHVLIVNNYCFIISSHVDGVSIQVIIYNNTVNTESIDANTDSIGVIFGNSKTESGTLGGNMVTF